MKIEFEKGEMIVTHPSGHVDRYQRSDIDMQKIRVQEQIDELKFVLDILTNCAIKIQNSLGTQ